MLLRGVVQKTFLGGQRLLQTMRKFPPLRFGAWGERTKRTDHPGGADHAQWQPTQGADD
jgi:hypothetical protein